MVVLCAEALYDHRQSCNIECEEERTYWRALRFADVDVDKGMIWSVSICDDSVYALFV